MKHLFTLVVLVLLLMACSHKNDKTAPNLIHEVSDTTIRSMNDPSKPISELKKSVMYKGDTNAYEELRVAYLDETFNEEFLIYAMVMANKYDYPQAYWDVFDHLRLMYWSDINQIDEQTATLAIDYLLKASKRGHHQAREEVEEHNVTRKKNNKQQIVAISKW